MTARDRADVLIALETGSSGAIGLYSVIAYQNGAYQTVFDSEQYARQMRYRVRYLDQYAVRAESENTGMAYFIDLAGKDSDYLAQLYDENGRLKREQEGFVDPVSLLYPCLLYTSHHTGFDDREGSQEERFRQSQRGFP